MIKTIFILTFICLAIVVGPYLTDAQGFVHIATNQYVIETSLTTAIVAIIITYLVLWLVLSILRRCWNLPNGTRRWFRSHTQKKKLSLQDEAFLAYEMGDDERSLGLILKLGRLEQLPIQVLFIGAKASFNLGKYDKTRAFLNEALKHGADATTASEVVRAKLNLRVDNVKASLENLNEIKDSQRNKLVYKLYYESYKRNADIESIDKISPKLLKYQLISQEEADNLSNRAFELQLREAQGADDMAVLWKKLPRTTRKDPHFMGAFCNRLVQLGDVAHAQKISLEILKQGADPDFLESISTWDISIPEVLNFLKKFSDENMIASEVNLPLLKALGNLEFRSGFMQDALEHYKKALELEHSAEVYNKLGQVLAGMQNFTDASVYFSKAAHLTEQNQAIKLSNS